MEARAYCVNISENPHAEIFSNIANHGASHFYYYYFTPTYT